MKEYVKAVLYAYPLLKTVEKDYEDHIRNKALLSYDGRVDTERLVEYIAGEILCKQKLGWLKSLLEDVFDRLNEEERALVEIRYLGKTKNIRYYVKGVGEEHSKKWSERMYFRRQKRLYEKLSAMLNAFGLTEEVYEREFSRLDIFKKVDKLLKAEQRDRESRWLKSS